MRTWFIERNPGVRRAGLPAQPTPRQQLVRAEGGGVRRCHPCCQPCHRGVGQAGGGGVGGNVGVGGTNDNKGQRSKGWHDVLWRSSSHLRLRIRPPLYFLMHLNLASQPREPAAARANPPPGACNRRVGSHGIMIWGHGGCLHGDIWQSRWG